MGAESHQNIKSGWKGMINWTSRFQLQITPKATDLVYQDGSTMGKCVSTKIRLNRSSITHSKIIIITYRGPARPIKSRIIEIGGGNNFHVSSSDWI